VRQNNVNETLKGVRQVINVWDVLVGTEEWVI